MLAALVLLGLGELAQVRPLAFERLLSLTPDALADGLRFHGSRGSFGSGDLLSRHLDRPLGSERSQPFSDPLLNATPTPRQRSNATRLAASPGGQAAHMRDDERPSDRRDPVSDRTDPTPEERPGDPSPAELRRQAEMADPREPPGEAPEGRHPGAQDRPQGEPADE